MRRILVVGGGVLALVAVAFVVFLKPIFVAPFDGAPYLKLGEKYDINPFRGLARLVRKKGSTSRATLIPPSPGKKIQRITKLSKKASFAAIGKYF